MEKEQALQALLDQVVRQGDFIGVSALYLRDGKQLAYAQAGMADRERGIPFARDTICRVFSMSKPITAFAVMKLWEDGKLDLDAPVAAYLPEFGDAEHTNLTIRQLLCMTSGYGYNDNDSVQSAGLGRLYDEISESFTKGGQRTTRQVIAEMAKLPLLYRPGRSGGSRQRDELPRFFEAEPTGPAGDGGYGFLCAGSQAWPVCPSV